MLPTPDLDTVTVLHEALQIQQHLNEQDKILQSLITANKPSTSEKEQEEFVVKNYPR